MIVCLRLCAIFLGVCILILAPFISIYMRELPLIPCIAIGITLIRKAQNSSERGGTFHEYTSTTPDRVRLDAVQARALYILHRHVHSIDTRSTPRLLLLDDLHSLLLLCSSSNAEHS